MRAKARPCSTRREGVSSFSFCAGKRRKTAAAAALASAVVGSGAPLALLKLPTPFSPSGAPRSELRKARLSALMAAADPSAADKSSSRWLKGSLERDSTAEFTLTRLAPEKLGEIGATFEFFYGLLKNKD